MSLSGLNYRASGKTPLLSSPVPLHVCVGQPVWPPTAGLTYLINIDRPLVHTHTQTHKLHVCSQIQTHTDILRDSPTHVDTLGDTPTKTHTPHMYNDMLIITDKLTLIWACSRFSDMTSCCSEMCEWPKEHRRGSKAKWWTCRSRSRGRHKVGQGA